MRRPRYDGQKRPLQWSLPAPKLHPPQEAAGDFSSAATVFRDRRPYLPCPAESSPALEPCARAPCESSAAAAAHRPCRASTPRPPYPALASGARGTWRRSCTMRTRRGSGTARAAGAPGMRLRTPGRSSRCTLRGLELPTLPSLPPHLRPPPPPPSRPRASRAPLASAPCRPWQSSSGRSWGRRPPRGSGGPRGP